MPAGSYSDVVLMPDGTTVKSLTVSNPNGIAAGIDSLYNSFHSNLYTTNFAAHWRGDRAQINASVQYNWSNEGNYFVEQILDRKTVVSGRRGSVSVDLGGSLVYK